MTEMNPDQSPTLEPVSPPVPPPDAADPSTDVEMADVTVEPAFEDEVAVDLPYPIDVAVDRRGVGRQQRPKNKRGRSGFSGDTYSIDQLFVRSPTMECLEKILQASESLAISVQLGVSAPASSEMSMLKSCTFTDRGHQLSAAEWNQIRGIAVGKLFDDLMKAFRRVGGQEMLLQFYASRVGEDSGGLIGGDA